MKHLASLSLLSLLTLSPLGVARAQEPLGERVERLEAESELLRAELARLAKRLAKLEGHRPTPPLVIPAESQPRRLIRRLVEALQDPWERGSVAALVSSAGAFRSDGRPLIEQGWERDPRTAQAFLAELALASDDLRGREAVSVETSSTLEQREEAVAYLSELLGAKLTVSGQLGLSRRVHLGIPHPKGPLPGFQGYRLVQLEWRGDEFEARSTDLVPFAAALRACLEQPEEPATLVLEQSNDVRRLALSGELRARLVTTLKSVQERRPPLRTLDIRFRQPKATSPEQDLTLQLQCVRLQGSWRLLAAKLLDYVQIQKDYVTACRWDLLHEKEAPRPLDFLRARGVKVVEQSQDPKRRYATYGGGAFRLTLGQNEAGRPYASGTNDRPQDPGWASGYAPGFAEPPITDTFRPRMDTRR